MLSVSQIDQGGRRIERKKIKEFRRILMFSGDSGDGFLRVREFRGLEEILELDHPGSIAC